MNQDIKQSHPWIQIRIFPLMLDPNLILGSGPIFLFYKSECTNPNLTGTC